MALNPYGAVRRLAWWAPDRAELARVLFLLGIFLMVTGDWPPAVLHVARSLPILRLLAWPWLYLALVAISFVLLASTGAARRKCWIATRFLLRPLTVLAGCFLFSTLFSQVPSLSWLAFGGFLGIAASSLAALYMLEEERLLAAVPAVLAAAAAFLALRVIMWRLDEGIAIPANHVGNNAWLGKLQLTWVLSLVAPFLLAWRSEAKSTLTALLYSGTWLLTGAAVQLLFSRTGAVAFALSTVALWVADRRSWRRWLGLLAALTGLVLVPVALNSPMAGHVVNSLIQYRQDSGFAMRIAVWLETVEMIRDYPVAGIGLGTYDDVAYSRYGTGNDRHFFRNGWHAHNVLLHTTAETGVLGLLAWCYFWVTIARYLARARREERRVGRLTSTATLCMLLAFFVLSLTENLIAARVHASLRMNLTLGLLVVYGIRVASESQAATTGERWGRPQL